MKPVYAYRTAGRKPLIIGCYLLALACIFLSARNGAGPLTWALWAAVTTLLCHQLLGYPLAGSQIDGTCWTTFVDRRRRIIAVKQIRQVILTGFRGARCSCLVQLQDRSTIRIPATCLPPAATLAKVLRRNGIKVVIDRRKRGRKPAQNTRSSAASNRDTLASTS